MSVDKRGKLNIKYLSKQDFQKTQDSYELKLTSLGLNSEPDFCVIDGLTFEKQLMITGNYSGEIIIRNCYFFRGITVNSCGVVTLENSKLTNCASLVICSNNLIIKNISINNHPKISDVPLNIMVNDGLYIINSVLGSEHHSPCLYVNKSLSLTNSMIIGEEINCYADSLISDDFSSIFATTKVELIVASLSNIKITTPAIVYNNYDNHSETNEVVDYFIKDSKNIKIRKRRLN